MSNSEIKQVDKPLDTQAERIAKQHALDYAALLLYHAKIIATRAKSDKVTVEHIEEALEKVSKNKAFSRARELSLIIGGAFFGTAVQGFIAELAGLNVPLIVAYVLMGFFSMLIIFWGLNR